jgi:hypothetical protein
MNMPGFTAEASLSTTRGYYQQPMRRSDEVRNQGVISQWVWTGGVTQFEREVIRGIPLGGGGRLPPNPTECDWLFFCCTEYHDPSCCQRWRLRCIPE